jgi:hypothetical protein
MVVKWNPGAKAFVIGMTMAGLGGCLSPPDGYIQPQPIAYSEPQTPKLTVQGCWSFNDDKGNRRTNLVEILDENTVLVSPSGRPGGMRQYNRIGEALYQDADGPGTYQFTPSGTGVWRSNNKSNFIWRLSYAGNYC